MRKSTLSLVETLKAQLLQVSKMTDMVARRDPSLVEVLIAWTKSTESILASYTISDVAELAGLRSKLLSLRQAHGSGTTRRERYKVASDLLYEIQHVVLVIVKPHEEKVAECRALVRQLLSLVSQSGALPYDTTISLDVFLDRVWSAISRHDQLKSSAARLRSILVPSDVMRLLAEEIDLAEWAPKGDA